MARYVADGARSPRDLHPGEEGEVPLPTWHTSE